MKHFTITIKIAYDEDTAPADIEQQLKENVERCVECHDLLNDDALLAVVEEWRATVEEITK